MLHVGARTKFILHDLTECIPVNFSIRQGDPIAMLLYILYAEPLLMYIEMSISGLRIENFVQSTESYCDDLNVFTDNEEDLLIVDEAVRKFELVSGAILSRNHKCKVIGFGSWRKKKNWRLPYLTTVDEIKIFGIFIMNSYQCMLRKNWDHRLRKLDQSLISWSSRVLPSIFQRVEVLNVFAFSRIFYVASILPIPKNVIQKIEKSAGRFLWAQSGKVLRVSKEDSKNAKENGGLGLICLSSMNKSLLVSQFLRLLKFGEEKAVFHMFYWMGPLLNDFLTGLSPGFNSSVNVPLFYETVAEALTETRIMETVTPLNWKNVTNKLIYVSFQKQFILPKIAREIGHPLTETWRKLYTSGLSSHTMEIIYLSIHDKLPIPERLFRINLINDPYCQTCFETRGAEVSNREHFFCTCSKVQDVWNSVRKILLKLLPPGLSDISSLDLLTLNFRKCDSDKEVVWLVGSYMEEVWRVIFRKGSTKLSKKQVFGFLTFKFKADQQGSRGKLKEIVGLDELNT